MIRLLTTLPRPVLISSTVIVTVGVLFAILVPLLGGARDDAFGENARLTGEIQRANVSINQARTDITYIKDNQEKYEALLKSDRLVPHTRRTAVVELQNAARATGLTSFTYSIGKVSSNSLRSATGQPSSGDYEVSLEEIGLVVKAPYDGSIYRFIDSLTQNFPGAAVVYGFNLTRGLTVSDGVEGQINVTWRTAQAKDKGKK